MKVLDAALKLGGKQKANIRDLLELGLFSHEEVLKAYPGKNLFGGFEVSFEDLVAKGLITEEQAKTLPSEIRKRANGPEGEDSDPKKIMDTIKRQLLGNPDTTIAVDVILLVADAFSLGEKVNRRVKDALGSLLKRKKKSD